MQRILEPDQIEALDHTAIVRVRLPEPLVFAARAKRLRELASDNPIEAYLLLMAALVDAQHEALASTLASSMASAAGAAADRVSIEQGQRNLMPIFPALSNVRSTAWRNVLVSLIEHVHAASDANAQLTAVIARLRASNPDELERQADAVLAGRSDELDNAVAPFIAAALQVVWTGLASRCDVRDVPMLETGSVCPVCGSQPIGSIVRIGGTYQGYRYLQCGLCATEWHMVRVKCTHCESTRGIMYHAIEGGGDALKAESCDVCHTYRKILYQDKAYDAEPFADDLASVMLDLLMNDAGYRRPNANPFLWTGDGQTGA
jgi:FdhE protein